MFRRRKSLTWAEWLREQVWPRAGLRRASLYLWHRLCRLPDPPERIARGVFAGTFVNFPPIFGFQLLGALGLAWALRGNYLAAALATLLSNPLTTPAIAVMSLKLGHWMLGTPDGAALSVVWAGFALAGAEIWNNLLAPFTLREAHWEGLAQFGREIWLPYLLGSIPPGLVSSALLWGVTLRLMRSRRRRGV